MADLISRLKLESGEFDSKIKRAGQELLAYSEHCKKMGLQMGYANADAKKFAAALGSMTTTAQSTRGKLNELTQAFTDLSVMYKNMTNEEKNSTFGKNLAASLDQLKTRINDTKAQLNDVSVELGNTKQAGGDTGGMLDQLTSKFGISIDKVVGWGTAIGAAKVALDVAKDAFMSSEGNIDEWGRTVEGAKGAYDVFLQTINNGNWSGFLSNLGNAVRGARDLYDALDRLGSIKSNNQAAIAIQQQQVQQLRLMKQQGQNVDAQLKAATERLATLQKQSVDAGKRAGSMMVGQTIRNGYQSQQGAGKLSGGSVDAAVNDIIKNGQQAFDKYAKIAADLEKRGQTTRTIYNADGTTGTKQVFDMNKLTAEQQKQYRLAKTITDRETEIQKGISVYAQAVQEGASAAREEFKGNRYAMAGTGGKGGKGNKKDAVTFADDSIMAQEKEVQRLTQLWKTAGDDLRDGYLKQLEDAQKKLAEMTGRGAKVDTSAFTFTESQLNAMTTTPSITVRGNNGRAQDKLDLATAAFATSGTSNTDINNYISGIKSALQDANLGEEMYNKLTEKLADTSSMSAVLQGAIAGGVQGADLTAAAEEMKQKLLKGDINEDAWQEFIDKLNEKIENEDLKLVFDVDTKTIETAAKKNKKETAAMAKEWQAAGSAIQAVGQAMSQIEDPAAKVLGTIAQAVATMALSYAQAAASPAVTGTGWGWIAFAATGVATMLSSISAIKQATEGFANGGIIPGNSYSGDNMRGMTPDGNVFGLNAGEVVLNASQQNNLANALTDNGMQGYSLETRVNGRDLVIVMNNDGTARGRGELVRTNRRG